MVCVIEFITSIAQGARLEGWEANRVRGALGHALRRVACTTGRSDCTACALVHLCAYGYCFETLAPVNGQFHSRGQEVPRPYVIRSIPGYGTHADRGIVGFDLVLLGKATQFLPYLVLAVKDWEQAGSGPGKSACDLIAATAHNPVTGERTAIYRQGDRQLASVPWQVCLQQIEQAASQLPEDEVTVDFLTPTRLRLRGEKLDRPDFHAVVASLVRRIEALHLYHDFPALDGSIPELIAAADGVELVGWSGDVRSQERYSSRQRQSMRMEGFVGRATYAGDLAPFAVLLKLGELIHVGKGAVFGLGQMRIVDHSAITEGR